jgi:hypothetical protein
MITRVVWAAAWADGDISEAAARALYPYLGPPATETRLLEGRAAAKVVLATLTPLIRDQVLEEAAKRMLELAREERNLDGATLSRAAEYLRAFKEQP